MSTHLTSLVWEIEFPTATQKLLLLRVADYADDNGSGIYPSIPEVARQVGASERQTQYAIRALEGVSLIARVKDGGGGPKHTNVWTINVDLLAELALQEKKLTGSHDALEAVDNTGAIIAPRTIARVQSRLRRVQSTTPTGAMGCTQTKDNQTLEPKDARERGRDDPPAPRAVKKQSLASFALSPIDVQWSHWMTWLTDRDKRDLVAHAEHSGAITVFGSKWPSEGSSMPKVDGPAPTYTDRMLGEVG